MNSHQRRILKRKFKRALDHLINSTNPKLKEIAEAAAKAAIAINNLSNTFKLLGTNISPEALKLAKIHGLPIVLEPMQPPKRRSKAEIPESDRLIVVYNDDFMGDYEVEGKFIDYKKGHRGKDRSRFCVYDPKIGNWFPEREQFRTSKGWNYKDEVKNV